MRLEILVGHEGKVFVSTLLLSFDNDYLAETSMGATIQLVAESFRQGLLTPIDLLNTCLHNIDRLEKHVQAWVLVDRDGAQQAAQQLTDEGKRGHWRSPLHGIPIGVKDIIDVFDWPTAAGSRMWAKNYARRDATVVDRLRKAGAILLGKTVTTAYASYDPPPTRNPWRLDRTPGGSSSGSAAALACGMCSGTLGTQTGGSITRPASYCGVSSCKPTRGRVSLIGVVPLAPSLDHVGPMARCVWDLAVLLQTIAGFDPQDSSSSRKVVSDWQNRLNSPLAAPRLGRLRGMFDRLADRSVAQMMDEISALFNQKGARVIDLQPPTGFEEVLTNHQTIMAVEAAAYHGPRLRRYPEDYPPKIRTLLKEGLDCPATEYARCRDHRTRLRREMQGCLNDVDALLTSATPGPAPAAATTGDPSFVSPWSYLGFPTVSLPTRWNDEGLPLAIQLIGRPWREGKLFATAGWCEQIIHFESREVA